MKVLPGGWFLGRKRLRERALSNVRVRGTAVLERFTEGGWRERAGGCGAFEIPSAARSLAETKKYDAIVCIGCLLRGDTAHYDVIVNEVTRGIGQSAQETGVPHAFGVLTCETLEQAIDRAGLKMGNKGFEAALSAVEMANLKRALSTQHSAVSKKQVPRSARRD